MTDTSSLLEPPSWDPSSQEELSFRIRELRLRNRHNFHWYHSRSYLYGERFYIGYAIFDFNSSTASTGIVTNVLRWLDLDTRWRRIWLSSPLIGTLFLEWAKKKSSGIPKPSEYWCGLRLIVQLTRSRYSLDLQNSSSHRSLITILHYFAFKFPCFERNAL